MRKQSRRKTALLLCAAVLWLAAVAGAGEEIPDGKASLSFLGTEFDNLGHVVATGDFNGDGQEDLFLAGPGD